MSINSKQRQSIWRSTAMAAAIAGALSIAATAAYAGDCPADKRVADGKATFPRSRE